MSTAAHSIRRHDTQARMSRAVIHNGVAYLCGQVAGPEAREGDITEQTESMLARVDALLKEIGEGCAPARTCVCAPLPADELKVEITVTTAVEA